MTYQPVQEFASLQGDLGQPLIGVIAEEQGHEVVRYLGFHYQWNQNVR